jgi:hypothetical protein
MLMLLKANRADQTPLKLSRLCFQCREGKKEAEEEMA